MSRCLTGFIPSGVTDTPPWVMDSCQSHWELSIQPQGECFGTVIVSLIATKNTLFSRSLDRLGTLERVSGLKGGNTSRHGLGPEQVSSFRQWSMDPIISWSISSSSNSTNGPMIGWTLWHNSVIDHITDTGCKAYLNMLPYPEQRVHCNLFPSNTTLHVL